MHLIVASLLVNCQYVQNSLDLVENLMQIMHNSLIFMCKWR